MKILSFSLLCAFPLFADSVGEGAVPPAGTPAGGYTPTVYNKDYSTWFVGKDADPTGELETIYPQSSGPLSSQATAKSDTDDRSTGSNFTAAQSQANYWLSLLDQQAYQESYSQAGGLLQDIVSDNIWAAAMKAVRSGLGNNTSRKVAGHQLISKLPHGTTGKFIQINFDSSFSSKGRVRETVIVMQQGKLGQWKVIAY